MKVQVRIVGLTCGCERVFACICLPDCRFGCVLGVGFCLEASASGFSDSICLLTVDGYKPRDYTCVCVNLVKSRVCCVSVTLQQQAAVLFSFLWF